MKQFLFAFAASIALAFVFPLKAAADRSDDAMAEAVSECVLRVASSVGSPVNDFDLWARVVSQTTVVSLARIEVVGLSKDSDFSFALLQQTKRTLIEALEEKGFSNFRKTTIATVDACVPEGVKAYSAEIERQRASKCPDMVDYLEYLAILDMSEPELFEKYGDMGETVHDMQPKMINVEIRSAFPQIFFYGQEGYPNLKNPAYSELDKLLLDLNLQSPKETENIIQRAIFLIGNSGEKPSQRIQDIKINLECLTNWIEIYPDL